MTLRVQREKNFLGDPVCRDVRCKGLNKDGRCGLDGRPCSNQALPAE